MPLGTTVAPTDHSVFDSMLFGGSEADWMWWQRELALILTLPGVTSNGYYGDVQLPENLPSSDAVQFFMRVLVHQYTAVERADAGSEFWDYDDDDAPDWYQFPTGVLEGGDVFLSLACRILSSYGAGYYVYDLRKNREYPEGWLGTGWGELHGSYRSMMDRLFDRLHINHTNPTDVSGADRVLRVATVAPGEERATWASGPFAPLTTYFCTRNSDFSSTDDQLQVVATAISGVQKMVEKLSGSGSGVLPGFTIGGLADPPSSMAFPLDWRQAGTAGLSGSRLWLPGLPVDDDGTTLGERLDDLLDDLDMSELRKFVSGVGYDVLESTNIAGLFQRNFLVALEKAHIIGDFRDIDWDEFVDQMPDLLSLVDTLAEYIATANDENAEAHATTYYLLCAMSQLQQIFDFFDALGAKDFSIVGRRSGFLEEALGMTAEELGAFTASFVPWSVDTGDFTEPYYPPVVVLGDPFPDHLSAFNGFEPGDPELLDAGVPEPVRPDHLAGLGLVDAVGTYANEVWQVWYQVATPTLDAARVFDIAGMVARQLVNVDDLQLALFREEQGTGVLADAIRSLLVSYDIPDLALPLEFTPGDVVGYLVRQLLTDIFIEYFVRHEGADREPLYLLFSWMDTADKRDHVSLALGEPVEIPLPARMRAWVIREGWRHLPGRTVTDPVPEAVWVRGCMTSALEGAVGVMARHFLYDGTDHDDEPDYEELRDAFFQLKDWTTDARGSDQTSIGKEPLVEYTEANWASVVREGVRQWELAESLQSVIANYEGMIDIAAIVDRIYPGLLDMPDGSLSPVSRAIKRACLRADAAHVAGRVVR